jgi:hypothetical protein
MGKTTIARIIGLAQLGQGWECYECRKPDDLLTVLRGDRQQVFIADDAFGTTEYRPEIANAWGDDLDSILRRLDKKHWLVWTSRPAPLKLALQRIHLQGLAEKFPAPAEVLVDASELTSNEKALILYRHAKNGGLEKQAKMIVKDHAESIVHNKHFTPERARRFVGDSLPRLVATKATTEVIREAIVREVEEATVSMKKSFGALNRDQQLFLIALLDAGSGMLEGDDLADAYRRIGGERVPSKVAEELTGHFLRKSNWESE